MRIIGIMLILTFALLATNACSPPDDLTEYQELQIDYLDTGDQVSLPPDNEKDGD